MTFRDANQASLFPSTEPSQTRLALPVRPGPALAGDSELWLCRLQLDLRSRVVQTDLGNSQAMHRRLLDAFPGPTRREEIDLLYRIEVLRADRSRVIVLVQSTTAPDWSALPPGYIAGGDGAAPGVERKRIGAMLAAIQPGREFRFRLRANPTRKVHITEGNRPTGPNGTRKAITSDDELAAWMARKGELHGFALLHQQHRPDPVTGDRQIGHKRDRRRMVHGAILYDGVLQVTDATALRGALLHGIGPAKAYGFGLLSLARA